LVDLERAAVHDPDVADVARVDRDAGRVGIGRVDRPAAALTRLTSSQAALDGRRILERPVPLSPDRERHPLNQGPPRLSARISPPPAGPGAIYQPVPCLVLGSHGGAKRPRRGRHEGSPEGPIPGPPTRRYRGGRGRSGHPQSRLPVRRRPEAGSASNRFATCSCGFGWARKPNRRRPPCRHAHRQAAGRRHESVVGGAGDGRRGALVPGLVSVPEGRRLNGRGAGSRRRS
jgi:hypothetical protein